MAKLINQTLISDRVKEFYYLLFDPIITFFIRLNVNPNLFTSIGLVFGGVSAVYAAMGSFRMAGVFLLLSGICDSIDGTIARRSGRESKFGALLDSTLDRYSEMLVFFGLAFYFIREQAFITSLALAIGLGGSLMVSYVRARAEGLGFECKVGMMQRVERIVLLAFGALTFRIVLVAAIWIIAILSNITAIHRIVHIRKKDRELVEETA
ncbi:CDP-alcohol phosphatidyltransferase family protein [bacterium]|nr:CDP-alcohol phosphatidyltransferase family protein [bacterium]